jgi:hypothetical protein
VQQAETVTSSVAPSTSGDRSGSAPRAASRGTAAGRKSPRSVTPTHSSAFAATAARSRSPRDHRSISPRGTAAGSKAVLSPVSDSGFTHDSTYSTDKAGGSGSVVSGYIGTLAGSASSAIVLPKRGKYMALASTDPIVDAEGVAFRQMDVKLKQIQLQRVDADNNVVVSMGLGITLMATPHGVVIASVTQPIPTPPVVVGPQTDGPSLKRPPTCTIPCLRVCVLAC